MARLHKNLKNTLGQKLERKIFGEKTYNKLHPIGTSLEKQYDARKEAENAAKDAANQPVVPLPDEEEIKRQQRRKTTSRGGGRASTIMTGGDQDTLGG